MIARRAAAEAAYRAAYKAHRKAIKENATAHARRAALDPASPEWLDAHNAWMLASVRLSCAADELRKAGAAVLALIARGAK